MAFDLNDIRSDFPILGRTVYGKPLVYLDNAATAQKPRSVIECQTRVYEEFNSNVHRGVHYLAERSTELYEQARETVREFINASSREEIVFTSGATAALNAVAYSWGEHAFSKGDNIVISGMEHHSNIVPWQLVCRRKGVEIRVLKLNDRGELDPEHFERLVDRRTKVLAVTQASNVLGTRPDLKRLIDIAHRNNVTVVVDGCQGIVHGGVDVRELGCDFYAFSGHKLYGPNGTGVLYGRRELLEEMPPFMGGGDMVSKVSFEKTTYAELPLKFEAGTANYTGAIGLAEAIRYVKETGPEDIAAHERTLLSCATEKLRGIDGLTIYGDSPSKCSIVSFNIGGVHSYDLGMILDKMGVAIRTGSHCADPLMAHYGVEGMCRASFAFYNTLEEIDVLTDGINKAVRMLK